MCVVIHYRLAVNVTFAHWCFAILVFWLSATTGASTVVVDSIIVFILGVHVGFEHGLEISDSY